MDINNLSPSKKRLMGNLINLITLACLDNEVSQAEKDLINNLAESYGFTEEEFKFCADKAEEGLKGGHTVVEIPDTDEEKASFLKNLTLMMMVDGQIDDKEKQYVKFIAEKFGYDGDKAIDILIQSIYNDFYEDDGSTRESGGNTKVTGSSDKGMSNEEFQAETKRLYALGKEALTKHEISDAFDYLLIPAHVDADAAKLFLMIINTHNRLSLINKEQAERLKEYAERGYALSQYAYGRYLEALRPDSNALNTANEYFKAAEKGGISDALHAQAMLYKSGHYGQVDLEEVERMVNEALDKGSILAARYLLNRYIYGNKDTDPDPQRAIDILKEWLNGNESDDIAVVNPMFYSLIGDAYAALNDVENAQEYYTKAIAMGFHEACSGMCALHMNYDNDDDLQKSLYEAMIETGCEAGDPFCYLYRAAFNMDNYVEGDSKMTGDILHDLITAAEMGCDSAPYYLGDAYYHGSYGFKEDNASAWNMFIEGSKRDDGDSYKMLAVMIANNENPNDVPEGFMEHCAIMALRNGCDGLLKEVVQAYRNGELTDYAAEIEKYYIPRYENLPQDDDDEDDDDEEYGVERDGYDYKLIAVVKTDGKADIIEFDVEEGWDELPEFVGANRLDAIRTQPLYDISDKFGYISEHITAWVDNMGLMKELPMNPIGCKLYPGPIAGDMILTIEDAKYNPKSFDDLAVLKKVIAALGAKLDNICLDDGPDDDGRYDAWS